MGSEMCIRDRSSLTRWEKYKRVVGLVCESTHRQWAACDETAENRIGTSRSLISKHGRETRRDFTSGNSVYLRGRLSKNDWARGHLSLCSQASRVTDVKWSNSRWQYHHAAWMLLLFGIFVHISNLLCRLKFTEPASFLCAEFLQKTTTVDQKECSK